MTSLSDNIQPNLEVSASAKGEKQITCRHCLQSFNPALNHSKACRYHPEYFSGETAQRWLPPGETKGGGVIHNFWSCCGSYDELALGCCFTAHAAFGDMGDYSLRRPGMGIENNDT
jgi:hypothetical protein